MSKQFGDCEVVRLCRVKFSNGTNGFAEMELDTPLKIYDEMERTVASPLCEIVEVLAVLSRVEYDQFNVLFPNECEAAIRGSAGPTASLAKRV